MLLKRYPVKDETFSNYLRKVQIFSVHRAHEGLGFCYIAEFSMKVSYTHERKKTSGIKKFLSWEFLLLYETKTLRMHLCAFLTL